ncbi:MAG: nuclear transport factor 2 family protein [Fimbriimonadaceae bacterium]|nr:nuclear transport factor 2 family protein [Chitinophagales bacterium]
MNSVNEQLIRAFYESFQKKDYAAMQQFYADEIEFNDEVFVGLKGKQAKAMWHMLVERSGDLSIIFSDIKANEASGSANWIAIYTFSRTGRKVINKIHANFIFNAGKIIKHTDHFNFWKWSSMALGLSGKLLGWTPFLKNKIRKVTSKMLQQFIEAHPQYQ